MRRMLLLLLVVSTPAVALAEDAGNAALQRFVAGDSVVYSGESKVVQRIGGEVAFEGAFDTSVLTLVEKQAKHARLTVIRGYSPTKGSDGETPEGPSGGITREWIVVDGGKLIATDPPPETQETKHPPGVESETNIYFPFDLVPPFEAPEIGTDRLEEAQLMAVGQIPVKAKIRVKAQSSGGVVVLTRALDAGSSPTFEFRRMPATIETWSEEYHFEDGRLKSANRRSLIVVDSGDESTKMQIKVSSSASQTTHITEDADKAALAKALAPFRQLQNDFRARAPSDTLEGKLAAFKTQVADTKLRVLADVLQARLAGYRQLFELEEGGKLLAKIFGNTAPDFEFKDLSGQKRKLSEIIKGKIAYLNFWGVG